MIKRYTNRVTMLAVRVCLFFVCTFVLVNTFTCATDHVSCGAALPTIR